MMVLPGCGRVVATGARRGGAERSRNMMTLKVEISGLTSLDLEAGLEQVRLSIENGNTNGFDSNDTGQYFFDIDGEEQPQSPCSIDYDRHANEWRAQCREHGRLGTADGDSREGHDRMVGIAVTHDRDEHAGDGVVPAGMLFSEESSRG
jgi:hypothetical protein